MKRLNNLCIEVDALFGFSKQLYDPRDLREQFLYPYYFEQSWGGEYAICYRYKKVYYTTSPERAAVAVARENAKHLQQLLQDGRVYYLEY